MTKKFFMKKYFCKQRVNISKLFKSEQLNVIKQQTTSFLKNCKIIYLQLAHLELLIMLLLPLIQCF